MISTFSIKTRNIDTAINDLENQLITNANLKLDKQIINSYHDRIDNIRKAINGL